MDISYPRIYEAPFVGAKGDITGKYLKKPNLELNAQWDFNTKLTMQREITILQDLNHNNIPKIYGLCIKDGFVVGYYIDKYDLTLRDAMDKKMVIDLDKFMLVLKDTVHYIHQKGYVHGDLHWQNIMVAEKDCNNPYIIDFDSCQKIYSIVDKSSKYIDNHKKYTIEVDEGYVQAIYKRLCKYEFIQQHRE